LIAVLSIALGESSTIAVSSANKQTDGPRQLRMCLFPLFFNIQIASSIGINAPNERTTVISINFLHTMSSLVPEASLVELSML
jgi:hypothetical protein